MKIYIFILTFYILLFTGTLYSKEKQEKDSLLILIEAQLDKSNFDTAFLLIDNAEKKFAESNDKKNLVNLYILKSAANIRLNNYSESVEILTHCLTIIDTVNDKERLAEIKGELGVVYFDLKDMNKAKHFISEAYEIMKTTHEVSNSIILNYGIINYIDEADEALKYFLKESSQIDTSEKTVLIYLNNYIGHIYMKQKKFTEAIKFFKKSLIYSKQQGNKFTSAMNLSSVAYCFLKLNNIDSAIFYNNTALDYAEQNQSNLLIKECLITFLDIYYLKGDLENYHQTRIKLDKINKKYFGSQTKTEIAKLEYNFKLKILENKEQAKRKVLQIIIYASLIILLLIIVFFILRQKTKNIIHQQKIKLLEEEKLKLDLEIKNKQRELLSNALIISKNNTLHEDIVKKLKTINLSNSKKNQSELKKIINEISLASKTNWEEFFIYFNELFKDFSKKIKKNFTNLTNTEYKIIILIKLNMTTKDIANFTYTSQRTIEKHRQNIRKKLKLDRNTNLDTFIKNL